MCFVFIYIMKKKEKISIELLQDLRQQGYTVLVAEAATAVPEYRATREQVKKVISAVKGNSEQEKYMLVIEDILKETKGTELEGYVLLD